MNQNDYNEAWTKLMAARRSGSYEDIHQAAEALAHAVRVMILGQQERGMGPCSHFMVANGHCINCHELVGSTTN